ncbi:MULTISPECIES: phosphatase PAP2 family protein [unclassified Arcicella]|uniref:phosphatase PAP2 family protein n=1 Tax=unclassified Arcicella TaxID=2644986 RepID=UPI002854EB8E|nr:MULTISPECIES: phosphatase PAP2 family protein [unclassified Arcicella]MDR6560226.1 membrane-associated phospholipid phosphatase [Arcicella sp. BE51]MDR6810168.1 membrane-associated phospholipid phosphatase [Arcicella sp. BE140]MDR6821517.1 membrane-associated phospholipid phosphatase [Arcicella sp. BE139]
MKKLSLDFWALDESKSFLRFTQKNIILTLLISVGYFIWFGQVIAYRPEHSVLYFLLLFLFYCNSITRSFMKAMFPFVIFWVVYDSLRIIPNYTINPIHIQQPYLLEKFLFGVNDNGVRITLNEYFTKYHTTFLDLLSGLFYINWVPVPLLFGIYVFLKDKTIMYSFAYCFLFVNLIGFCVYYIYPAAPPWYVAEYGFTEHFNIMGNVGNLKYFDALVGSPIFKGIYEKNANVFAAMPSLHSAYPLIVLYFAIQKKMGKFIIFFVVFCLGIWGSAVYSNHHYVIDVLAGISCAVLGITLFNVFVRKPMIKYILPL